MQALKVQLQPFPIFIVCYSNGQVSFERMGDFSTIVDQPEDGVQAIISNEDICIGANTVISYNEMLDYKEMPELLSWLLSAKLEMPIIRKGF